MKRTFLFAFAVFFATMSYAQREKLRLDDGWKFHFGNASSPEKDFGAGTEYFNYLTKAASIHNEGPYTPKFDDSTWQPVRVPHDWVTTMPYAEEASHSHGYKTVGWKYPETSVGWYRLKFNVPETDLGRYIALQFDGIFRNSQVWLNGIFMGNEPSGYATQVYEISDYINYGGENVLCVRADATLEEGWFYEGAGIYRNAWLIKSGNVHVAPFGTFVYSELNDDFTSAHIIINNRVENSSLNNVQFIVENTVLDTQQNIVGKAMTRGASCQAKEIVDVNNITIDIENPHLWNTETPYLYTLRTDVKVGGNVVDTYYTRFGVRKIEFTADEGFFLNGKNIKLRGVNMHQDHAGVGSAIPDALQRWRIKQLKKMGVNAYRASHNPMTPALLDICDEEGILVINENRLAGTNDYHRRLLENFIIRDRNHPSIIMWSASNEEWGLENSITGTRIAASMNHIIKRIDPTRPSTMANAGGTEQIKGADVIGYNYIIQNDVHNRRNQNPSWRIYGSEETTGTGTRGVYFNSIETPWHMASLNRVPLTKEWQVDYNPEAPSNTPESYTQGIERGWKFYRDTAWGAGVFWWTGFDYRGEPNPLKYPAHDSQFGLLDYCGFWKDEAYYLKAAWTTEPMVHILPHWNLEEHEGELIDVWAYSNCDEVSLTLNGKNLGRKPMPKDGHITWKVPYKAGKLVATAYKNGRKVATDVKQTAGSAVTIKAEADRTKLIADGHDVAVINITLFDKRGNFAAVSSPNLIFKVEGNARILGAGNGDPACKVLDNPATIDCKEFHFPAFNGHAQVIIQTTKQHGNAKITVSGDGLNSSEIIVTSVSNQQ